MQFTAGAVFEEVIQPITRRHMLDAQLSGRHHKNVTGLAHRGFHPGRDRRVARPGNHKVGKDYPRRIRPQDAHPIELVQEGASGSSGGDRGAAVYRLSNINLRG